MINFKEKFELINSLLIKSAIVITTVVFLFSFISEYKLIFKQILIHSYNNIYSLEWFCSNLLLLVFLLPIITIFSLFLFYFIYGFDFVRLYFNYNEDKTGKNIEDLKNNLEHRLISKLIDVVISLEKEIAVLSNKVAELEKIKNV